MIGFSFINPDRVRDFVRKGGGAYLTFSGDVWKKVKGCFSADDVFRNAKVAEVVCFTDQNATSKFEWKS